MGVAIDLADSVSAGEPPPIVLIPGLDGTALLFYRQIALLAPDFDVSTFPLLGDGDHTMHDLIDGLVERIGDVSDRGAILIGESFGGALAMSTALAHPDAVRGLVIVNSFPWLARRFQIRLAPYLLRLMPWVAMPLVRTFTEARLHSSHTLDEDLAQFRERARRIERRGYIRRLELLGSYDIRSQLHRLTAPTLFLAADEDRLLPSVRWARYMAERVPDSELTILAGYGHICLINHDLDLLDHVAPWWARVERERRDLGLSPDRRQGAQAGPMTTTASNEANDETKDRSGMVVGIDGSPGSSHALAWARGRIQQFGSIRPVAAWQYPSWAMADPILGTASLLPLEDFAAAAYSEARDAISSIPADEREELVLTRSPAGQALVENGADAELIVVGTRGRGAIADSVLGSVSCHVVNHSTVPVAVIPADAPLDDGNRRVIVGIDGSPNSIQALTWALSVSPSDVTVEAVHVLSRQLVGDPESYVVSMDFLEAEGREVLKRSVNEAQLLAGRSECQLVETLEHGDARNVLRELSQDADLLVIGARGHQGVAHLLLGSVTSGLVHQPLIATVVVPI